MVVFRKQLVLLYVWLRHYSSLDVHVYESDITQKLARKVKERRNSADHP
jgi:hypothetical protein